MIYHVVIFDSFLIGVINKVGKIKMKILITTVQIPFVTGGAELLAENLRGALIKRGHEAEILTIPFMDTPLSLIEDHIVASRLLQAENFWCGAIDLCIGLKFPAYFMPHNNKVLWVLHQHRAAYDLYNTEYVNIKDDPKGNRIKNIIKNADNRYLLEAKKIYTISANVANRMKQYNHIMATPLYHPCPDMDRFYTGKSENYILMPSRINITKRQFLAVEAMKYVKSNVKLYIAGGADNPYERDRMLATIKEKRLEKKVIYLDYVEQDEKIKLYANARAVLFIPIDEDYGYITLEGMAAGKAVITAEDSGGPLEFVEDKKNGLIVGANAREIAECIDYLSLNESDAIQMGKAGQKKLKKMNISWDYVVKELTGNS